MSTTAVSGTRVVGATSAASMKPCASLAGCEYHCRERDTGYKRVVSHMQALTAMSIQDRIWNLEQIFIPQLV